MNRARVSIALVMMTMITSGLAGMINALRGAWLLLLFLACASFLGAQAEGDGRVLLERVNMQRIEEKSVLLSDRISGAQTRRFFVGASLGFSAVTLLVWYLVRTYSSEEKNVSTPQDPEERKRLFQERMLRVEDEFFKRLEKKDSFWGSVENMVKLALAVTVAQVVVVLIKDSVKWGTGFSWETIRRFFSETSYSCFFHACKKLDRNTQKMIKSLSRFIDNLDVLKIDGVNEPSIPYKDFLYAELLVDYRVFLDSIEDFCACLLERAPSLGCEAQIRKSIFEIQQLVDDVAVFFEEAVNDVEALLRKKNVQYNVFVFSKKIAVHISNIVMSLGRTLHGKKFGTL